MADRRGQMEATAAMYGGQEGAAIRQEWKETRQYDRPCAQGHPATYRPAVGLWCDVTDSPANYCKEQEQQ